MSPISPITQAGVSPATSGGSPKAGGSAASSPSLLPFPVDSTVDAGNAISLLYVVEAQEQSQDVKTGSSQIEQLELQRNKALAQEQQAIAKEDAAAKSHDFWDDLGSVFGDVAKVAGIVASIAAVVCTAGAATPIVACAIAGAILSTASIADSQFHILQALKVDPKVIGYLDMGTAMGGAVFSLGAAAVAGAQVASSAATVTEQVAYGASGAAMIAKGAATIEAGQATADAENAEADEVMARAQSDHLLRLTQMVIDALQRSDDESKQMLNTLAGAKKTLNQTVADAAIAVRG